MERSSTANKMREIRIEKVVLNIGVGEPGEKLEKAKALLERITGKKAVKTFAKKRIPEFGVRPGLPIGVKVTLRKDDALKLLPSLLKAVDNTMKKEWFDDEGNITFGIEEYIHIPNVSYDPSLGVVGLSVTIKLERPGFRVKRRRYRRSKIGKKHKIKKEEAIEFMKQKFGVKVV